MDTLAVDKRAVLRTLHAFHRDRPVSIDAAVPLLGPLAGRRAGPTLHHCSMDDLARHGLRSALAGHAAVVVDGAVDGQLLASWVHGIDALGPDAGDRFGPGRVIGAAWYVFRSLFDDAAARRRAYRAAGQRGEQLLVAATPDLAGRCGRITETVLPGTVAPRHGFSGPGVVVFEGEGALGQDGDIHLDWEGLVADRPEGLFDEAYTFVLMLRPAATGAGLRLWGAGAHPGAPPVEPDPAPVVADYDAGTLVILPSQDLHQITTMWGERSRITATWHVRRRGRRWELWF